MATFYKGAGIGTHWHIQDSRRIGFTARAPQNTPTTEALLAHIATGTYNSPYISLTCSYAVAWDYAMNAGTDRPTGNNPAYVYEIEIDNPLSMGIELLDPIKEVARSLPDPTDVDFQEEFPYYQHNGLPGFLLSIVDPQNMSELQIGRQPQPPGPGIPCPPNLSDSLKALVNALRDAEILVHRYIPPSCVTNRFDVGYGFD